MKIWKDGVIREMTEEEMAELEELEEVQDSSSEE